MSRAAVGWAWSAGISRSSVARIRTEKDVRYEDKPKKLDLEQLAKIADEIDLKQYDERQLAFNFDADPEFKEQAEEFAKDVSLPLI